MYWQVPCGVLAEVLPVVQAGAQELGHLFQGDDTLQPDFWRLHAAGLNICPVSVIH